MDPSSSSLFRSSHPHQSVATVFLVENSQEMSVIWADLRDKYLNGLVNTLVQANPSVPVTVSVLESYASQSPGSNISLPRQYINCYDALQNVNFNFSRSNKITTSQINTCIDFLDNTKYQGQPPATHLIIVAATTPIDDANSYTGNAYTSWVHLSQKLKAKNIQCHLVVSPQHDMGSLTFLFEETLRIQGNVEEFIYPPSEPSPVIVRLSSKPNYELQNDIRATPASYPSARASVPRRNSYPLDNFYSENLQEGSGAPTNGDVEQPTSLVSQLQQVHGLTKKKVYGAKPIRQPFFRDERTRERYQQTPPLNMSMPIMDPNPSPTAGGRTMSQSRADRIGRLTQASPTDLHSGARRQHGWPRRGSRLSTPEADGYGWPSSPSVLQDNSPGSSYMSSSPVTPVTSFEEVYQNPVEPPCVPSMGPPGISPGMAAYQNGGIAEGAWDPTQIPRQVGSYNPAIQTYFPPAASHFYTNSGHITTTLPEMPPPPAQTTPAANSSMHQPTSAPQLPPPSSQPPVSTPPRASTTKKVTSEPDEDEERFMFEEDFVAATAALFEAEVLPAYPNYPGMSSGLFTNHRVEQGSQSLLSPQAGELYATRHKQNPPSQAPPLAAGGNLFNNSNNNPHINFAPSHPPPQAQVQFTRAHPHVPMTNMIGSQPSAYSYGVPAHAANYGSSLTGWAG